MDTIGFCGAIYRTRLCNDMSTYDTYGHTHCSLIYPAFICSGITNETRKISVTKDIDNNEHHQF